MTTKKKPKAVNAGGGKLTEAQHLKIVEALVFGELVRDAQGQLVTHYPTKKDLARRYGVTPAGIRYVSEKYNCDEQRRLEELRLQAAVRDELIDQRAKTIAHDKNIQVETIDAWLNEFRSQVLTKKVAANQATDYDRMLRLRSFVLGEADSRTETEIGITLHGLAERHRRFRDIVDGTPVGAPRLPPGKPATSPPAEVAQLTAAMAQIGDPQSTTASPPARRTPAAASPEAEGAPCGEAVPFGFYEPETGIVPPRSSPRPPPLPSSPPSGDEATGSSRGQAGDGALEDGRAAAPGAGAGRSGGEVTPWGTLADGGGTP